MNRLTLPVLLLSLLLFPACEDAPAPEALCPGGDADVQLTKAMDHYCEPMAQAVCDAAFACDCQQALQDFPDPATCRADWTARCAARLEAWRADLESGVLRWCDGAAARCVDAWRPLLASCGREMPEETLPAGCVQLLTVDTRPGEVCPIPGISCDDGRGLCSPYDGSCAAKVPGAGEVCQGVCADGLVCGVAGRCVAGAAGDACVDHRDCRPSLFCIDGACALPRPAGGACGPDTDCQPGLRCLADTCALPDGPCDAPEACGTQATCVASNARLCVPRVALGEPCGGDDCDDGAWCDGGTCVALPAAGEACADGVRCAPGLACDPIEGSCAALPVLGEPCAMDERGPFVCAGELACLGDVCGPLPTLGEACGSGDHACADGLGCAFNTDGTNTCEPRVGAGEPCTNDTQCLSGNYCEFALNLCAAHVPSGGACDDGNECGPSGSCVNAGEGGALLCVPMPGLGEPCLLDCRDGAICEFTQTAGTCVPPVCAEIPY